MQELDNLSQRELPKKLRRSQSILILLSLIFVLFWAILIHYFGSYQGGLAWLKSGGRSVIELIKVQSVVDHQRIITLFEIEKPDHLLHANERLIVGATHPSLNYRVTGNISDDIQNKVIQKVVQLSDTGPVHVTGYLKVGQIFWRVIIYRQGDRFSALLTQIDDSFLELIKSITSTEVELTDRVGSPIQSTFKSYKGSTLTPSLTELYTTDAKQLLPITQDGVSGYGQLNLAEPYQGSSDWHVHDTEISAFFSIIPFVDLEGKIQGWLWLFVPSDIMLGWPKLGILGLFILSFIIGILTLIKTNKQFAIQLDPINDLISDLESILEKLSGDTIKLKLKEQEGSVEKLQFGLHLIERKIEENKELELQLRQAQKMEAIGTLAGGVAHDFNNLLSVLVLNVECVIDEIVTEQSLEPEIQSEWNQMLSEVLEACEQAKQLTKQLLSISSDRGGIDESFELIEIVKGSNKLLKRLLPEEINLQLSYNEKELWLLGNQSALQQALMNLIINARDAINGSGNIWITIDKADIRAPRRLTAGKLESKSYVQLSVKDSGVGIELEKISKLFDPFFTSKGNKGTGLGLTITYHTVVKRFGGAITVDSRLNEGTTFTLYLPLSKQRTLISNQPLSLIRTPTHLEHIIFVEDNDLVRRAITQALKGFGYIVSSFSSGSELIQWISQTPSASISLIVTDVIMPGMSGPELISEIKNILPDVQAIYISGYAGDTLQRFNISERDLIMKPVSSIELQRKIEERLHKNQIPHTNT